MRIAAVDQGTTSTRVLLFEESARPRVVHSVRHRQIYPAPGWVEHDPLELLASIEACLATVGDVDAIGLANQGESCLAWDAVSGEPLSPVIVWQDNRTEAAVARLRADGLEAEVRQRAGLPLDSYFSASKLAWLLASVPAVAAAKRAGRLRLGTTDAFFLQRLTGAAATDATTASRTSLMNLATRQWDAFLCDAFGVPLECLPPIVATDAGFGRVGSAPLVASVVDQQAALYGHGCRNPGDAKVTFGTGAFALAVHDRGERPAGGLIETVAWQRGGEVRYALEGGVYDVGSVVEWAMRVGLVADPAELDVFDGPSAISRGIAFVPALSGLACPQWDRSAGGLFIGMTTATTRRDLQQAMLEGIAFQTREVLAAIDGAIALGDRISIDGGLTRSGYFVQCLADCTGKTILRQSNPELTAYGCALLAGFPEGAAAAGEVARIEPAPGAALAASAHRYAEAVSRSLHWRS
jgi:glycerol kinase